VPFGARLYSQAAWQGIVRRSNGLYYPAMSWRTRSAGRRSCWVFSGGRPAARSRRRLRWALVFPASSWRSCWRSSGAAAQPHAGSALLAIGLGLGVNGAGEWLATRLRRRRLATVAAILALALPGLASAALLARHSRPSTRDVAAAWMSAHLPPGSFLVQEQYTPLVGPEELYPARRPRFAARLEHAVLRDPGHDYLFLSSAAYQRFVEPPQSRRSRQRRRRAALPRSSPPIPGARVDPGQAPGRTHATALPPDPESPDYA
jgi:hypothetical protein